MGTISNYLDVPALVVFALMAFVLVKLRRDEAGQARLWVISLALIALECLARIFYLVKTGPITHDLMHILALNAYLLAGAIFLQSAAGGRFLQRRQAALYMSICIAPFVVLMICYGSMLRATSLYVAITLLGWISSLAVSIVMKRSRSRLLVLTLIWAPVIASAAAGDPRQAVYTSLFLLFILTALAFFRGLPGSLVGRLVVVAGFVVWGLCFLLHPEIARYYAWWLPLENAIWDLQKFVVMFGLLVVSLEEHSARADYLALHDELTGLANRRLFADRLQQAIARAKRDGSKVVVYAMDVNGFEEINDKLGYEVGSEVLRQIADRLGASGRESDTLARLGGDDFQYIASDFYGFGLDEPEKELSMLRRQGELLAEKFRDAAEIPIQLGTRGVAGKQIEPSLSIGFAVYPDEAQNESDLCYKADRAMHQDKRGRPGLVLSTPETVSA